MSEDETYNCTTCGVPLVKKSNVALWKEGQPMYCHKHYRRELMTSEEYTKSVVASASSETRVIWALEERVRQLEEGVGAMLAGAKVWHWSRHGPISFEECQVLVCVDMKEAAALLAATPVEGHGEGHEKVDSHTLLVPDSVGHGKYVCSCGNLIMQCRCKLSHETTIVPDGCVECRNKAFKGQPPTPPASARADSGRGEE